MACSGSFVATAICSERRRVAMYTLTFWTHPLREVLVRTLLLRSVYLGINLNVNYNPAMYLVDLGMLHNCPCKPIEQCDRWEKFKVRRCTHDLWTQILPFRGHFVRLRNLHIDFDSTFIATMDERPYDELFSDCPQLGSAKCSGVRQVSSWNQVRQLRVNGPFRLGALKLATRLLLTSSAADLQRSESSSL